MNQGNNLSQVDQMRAKIIGALKRNLAAEDGYGTYTVPKTVDIRAYDSGIAAGKKAAKLTTVDNLIERNADVIKFGRFGMLQRLHMRYLDFRMRQMVWKAVLFSPEALH